MKSVVRLALLACAALLSIATSPMPREYRLLGSTPAAGTPDVAPDAELEVQLELVKEGGHGAVLYDDAFHLVRLPGAERVKGKARIVEGPGNLTRVFFRPDAPLSSGEYAFRHEHQSYAHIRPPATELNDIDVSFTVR